MLSAEENNFGNIIKNIGIPPCPEILRLINVEINKEFCDFELVEYLISSDVSLSAGILKVVNTAFFDLSLKVLSINQAITILGLKRISNVIMELMIMDSFNKFKKIDMERFWDASKKIAAVNAFLSNRFGINSDDAYIFGLLKDCGIPILITKFDNYKDILNLSNNNAAKVFTELENENIGANHATIGYILSKNWYLPDYMCNGIRWHHDYYVLNTDSIHLKSKELILLSVLSEYMVFKITNKSYSVEWLKAKNYVFDWLSIDESVLGEYKKEIICNVKELSI